MKTVRTTRKIAAFYACLSLLLALVIPHIFDVLLNQCSCRKPTNNTPQVAFIISGSTVNSSSGSGRAISGGSNGSPGNSNVNTGATGTNSGLTGGTGIIGGSESGNSGVTGSGNTAGTGNTGGSELGNTGGVGSTGSSGSESTAGAGNTGGSEPGNTGGATNAGTSETGNTGNAGSTGVSGSGNAGSTGASGSGNTGSTGISGSGNAGSTGVSGSGNTGSTGDLGSGTTGGTGNTGDFGPGTTGGTGNTGDLGPGTTGGTGNTGGSVSGNNGNAGSSGSGNTENTVGTSSGNTAVTETDGLNNGNSESVNSNTGNSGSELSPSEGTTETNNNPKTEGTSGIGTLGGGGTNDGHNSGTIGNPTKSGTNTVPSGGTPESGGNTDTSQTGPEQNSTRIDVLPGLQPNPNQKITISGTACLPKSTNPIKPIVNPHNNKFIISNFKLCQRKPSLFAIIVIHTLPENISLRETIRNTWGHTVLFQRTKITIMFFMGVSSIQSVNDAVKRESETYRDISVQDFTDAFNNLSLKSMMWLEWCTKYCSNAEYVIKVEDLTVVNVYELQRTLQEMYYHQENGYRERFTCQIWTGMTVIRNSALEWHISKAEYADNVYPNYCSGLGYIVGKSIVPLLHNASFYVPYFKVEDVYVTGLLKKYLNIQTHNIWNKFAFNKSDLAKVTSGKAIFGFADKKDSNRYKYWDFIVKAATKS